MARPEIQGLKYFPFDVGFFRDKKVRLLRGEHDARGVEVYQRLLCKIYEDNGYYLLWNDSEDYSLLAEETGYSEEKIRLIVSSCLNRSLFDDTLFKGGNVLTSRSIQRRYFSAIQETKIKAAAQGRHTTIPIDLCLLTKDDLSEFNKTRIWLKIAQNFSYSENNNDKSPINEGKSPINPANEMKGNEMKGNESTTICEDVSCESGEVVVSEQTLIKHYLNHIQPGASKTVIDMLCSWQDVFPVEVIIKAVDIAVEANIRKYSYIEGTLRNWEKENLITLSLVENYIKSWKDKKALNAATNKLKKNKFANFEGRKYDYGEIEQLEQKYISNILSGGG